MKIYQAEIDAGLEHSLSAQSSIVYASLAEKSENISDYLQKNLLDNKTLAGLSDSDLYYTQSILVSTTWNKNDDIFDAKEVWRARRTPEDKPTNLEHDEAVIVGHITSNKVIDDSGKSIDNIDENKLPNKFHILTGSVIYRGFTEPELKSRASTLIEEIESGKKYVSMECFFKNFDYGLLDKSTGSYHILPRGEDTAFLTKHLRAYGGEGEHQNYKIGRVLRDITFSGKGFVNKPANPESVIFTSDNLYFDKDLENPEKFEQKNDDSLNKGVFSNQSNLKEKTMSVENEAAKSEEVVENTEVETVVSTPSEVVAQVEESVESVNETPDTETPVEAVAEEVVEEAVVEAAPEVDYEAIAMKTQEELSALKTALELAQTELAAANEALATFKAKDEAMIKQAKKDKRMASLIDSGVDAEIAQATVDKFEALDDETFATITSIVASKKQEKPEDEPKDMEEKEVKKTASVSADTETILETAEVEEDVNLSVASEEESQIQNTRAALVDFVCIRLGKKLNKGE